MNFIMVYCTIDTADNAKNIAKSLVQEKLAACVNILPSVYSIYKWENEVTEDSEFLLLIKTKKDLFDKLKNRITELHPYSIPEIIGVDIRYGSEAYLSWLKSNTL